MESLNKTSVCTCCGKRGYWQIEDIYIMGGYGGNKLCTACRDNIVAGLQKLALTLKKRYDAQKDGEDILGQIDFDKDE